MRNGPASLHTRDPLRALARTLGIVAGAVVVAFAVFAGPRAADANALLVTAIQQAGSAVTPNVSGTPTNPQPIALTLTSSFEPGAITAQIDAGNQFTTLRGNFTLPHEYVVNFGSFPSCSSAQVLADESHCPAGSHVGDGTAISVGLNLVEQLHFAAYNQPGGYGLTVLVTSDASAPVEIRDVMDLFLTDPASPSQGKRLMFALPADVAYPVAGVLGSLQSFSLTLPARTTTVEGRSIPYIGATGCTGWWVGKYSATYTTAIPFDPSNTDSTQQVLIEVPCTAGSGPPAPAPPAPTPIQPTGQGSPTPPASTPTPGPAAVKPGLSRSQRLRRAIKACNRRYAGRRASVRRKRASCVRKARRAYA